MVISLRLKRPAVVGMNRNNKVKLNGTLVSMNDIPFVRYAFEKYDDEEIEFIKQNMQRFVGPVHFIELSATMAGIVDACSKISQLENTVKFLYVNIDEAVMQTNTLEHLYDILDNIVATGIRFDRLMLRDPNNYMIPIQVSKFRSQLSNYARKLGAPANDIGICGSALSFRRGDTDGGACLTAVWARQLMTDYLPDSEINRGLPVASHECMDCCGCVKYFTVTEDIPAPLDPVHGFGARAEAVDPDASGGSEDASVSNDDDPNNNADANKSKKKAPAKPKGIPVFNL